MILASHGIIASSILQVDADWLAYYNRVIAAGGSLTTTEQNATKTLVADLKANGLWTPMKAIYPMVGASAAACAQNLKSSSFTGTFTSGWTFASTGVTPNGTSAYMNTGFALNSFSSTTSSCLTYYSRSNITYGGFVIDIGCNASPTLNPEFSIAMFHNGTTTYYSLGNYNFGGNYAVTTSAYYAIASRTSSTSLKGYKNGVLQATNTSLNTFTPTSDNIYIGACNFGGTPDRFSTRQCAFASLGDGFDDTQSANLYTAVQAFQTTLSRQV